MAEETFNPDDMPKTDRYQIPYPGPDNLVRFAADQFGAMATAIDTQLGNVDDRATDKAHATIVRQTLEQLQQSSPVQGQLGYVTADPTADNIGLWLWNGASWSKVSGATPMTVVKPTLAELQTVTDLSEGVFGLVSDDPVASNNGVYVFNNNAWAPITGTTGGTLAASTLSQLQATSAPTGTLAYVSDDEQNNGVYVRTAAGEWESISSGSSSSTMNPLGNITQDDIGVCYRSGSNYRLGLLGLPEYAASGSLFKSGQIYKASNSYGNNLAAIKLEPGMYDPISWSFFAKDMVLRSSPNGATYGANLTFSPNFTGTQGVDYINSSNSLLVINPIDVCFVSQMNSWNYGGSIGDMTVKDSEINNLLPPSISGVKAIRINGVSR